MPLSMPMAKVMFTFAFTFTFTYHRPFLVVLRLRSEPAATEPWLYIIQTHFMFVEYVFLTLAQATTALKSINFNFTHHVQHPLYPVAVAIAHFNTPTPTPHDPYVQFSVVRTPNAKQHRS